MLKLIYTEFPFSSDFKCKACGSLRSNEKGCIVVVRAPGPNEGALWTVCMVPHCVENGTHGQTTEPPPLIRITDKPL